MITLPKISVVTPSFNQEKWIEQALASVKNQGYAPLEHIVMDGASTDGTVELLRQYSTQPGWEHLRWVSERDRGQSDALNKGFRLASGDIVGWLNADDRYLPGCFQHVAEAFSRYADAEVVYGDFRWINEHDEILQVRREIGFSHFVLKYHHVVYIPSTATFWLRRIIDEGDLVNEQFQYAMDYEFFLRLAANGYHFRHVPELLADFRWQPESKTSTRREAMLREHDRAAEMHSPLLQRLHPPFLKKAALKTLRFLAATRRYSEKGIRGYYFTQFGSPRRKHDAAAAPVGGSR